MKNYEAIRLITKSKQYLTPLIAKKKIKEDLIDALNNFENEILSKELTISEIDKIILYVQHIYREKNIDYKVINEDKKPDLNLDLEEDDEDFDNPFD